MLRSSLSITVLAAAAAAGLLSTPKLSAQSTTPVLERPAATESDLSDDDALNMRRLVNEEARHRDRVARLARLRALAEKSGQTERLVEIDRLDRLETDRFEARTLTARSRMSEPALRQADDFVRRGGVMKVRRANQAGKADGQRATRSTNSTNSATERAAPQRKAATKRTAAPKATRSSTSSRGGRSGSGGRSPR